MTEPQFEADWTAEELRVMGVLMEKAIITPDQYPLSLNALVNGCNQSTSRDPVMDLDDDEVEESLTMLRDRKLVYRVDQAGARVPKYQHRLVETWELELREIALLAVLMLRGPQTLGQLRQRTERLYGFGDVEHVRRTLEGMMSRDVEPEQLVVKLSIQPGSKEVRYAHCLCPVEDMQGSVVKPVFEQDEGSNEGSVTGLRGRVAQLEEALAQLRQEFEDFKGQF